MPHLARARAQFHCLARDQDTLNNSGQHIIYFSPRGGGFFCIPLTSVNEPAPVNLSLKEKATISNHVYQYKMLDGYLDVDDLSKTRQQRMERSLSTPPPLVTDQNGQPDVRSSNQTALSFPVHWLEFHRQRCPCISDRWRAFVGEHFRSYLWNGSKYAGTAHSLHPAHGGTSPLAPHKSVSDSN